MILLLVIVSGVARYCRLLYETEITKFDLETLSHYLQQIEIVKIIKHYIVDTPDILY